jgi:hypothetical protein
MDKQNVGVRTKHLTAGALLALLLGGCLMDPAGAAGDSTSSSYPAHVTLEVKSDASDVAASGRKAHVLKKMIVLLTSSKRDTVCDTITSMGSLRSQEPAYLEENVGVVHLFARYDLKPGRRWNIVVKTLDPLDSAIHLDSVRVEGLQKFEYRAVRLDLLPRWVGSAARVSLPSTVLSEGLSRRVLFDRVELLVDGIVMQDTTSVISSTHCLVTADTSLLANAASRKYFRGGTGTDTENACALTLTHPYMKVGQNSLAFKAYGYLEGDTVGTTPVRLLLQGQSTVNTGLSKTAAAQSVSLEWVDVPGETEVASGVFVNIGKVGTVVTNVVVPGAILI